MTTISERSEIPLDELLEIGLTNAREAQPSVIVTRRGTRTVNGLVMLFQEMEGTVSGVPFTYYAHYFSDSSGTHQLLGWTATNLIGAHRSTIESFVSGFQLPK